MERQLLLGQQRRPPAVSALQGAIKITAPRGLIFVSGQTAFDPVDGSVLDKWDMEAQTRRNFDNIKALLEEGGASLKDVVKITAFLPNLKRDLPTYSRIKAVLAISTSGTD